MYKLPKSCSKRAGSPPAQLPHFHLARHLTAAERKLRKEAEKARVEEGTADLMNKLDLDGDEDLKKDALEALEQFTNAKM